MNLLPWSRTGAKMDHCIFFQTRVILQGWRRSSSVRNVIEIVELTHSYNKNAVFISQGWPNNSSLWNKWSCCLGWLTKTYRLIRCHRYTFAMAYWLIRMAVVLFLSLLDGLLTHPYEITTVYQRQRGELAGCPYAIATGLTVNRWDSKSSKIAKTRWISKSPIGDKNNFSRPYMRYQ